MKKTKKILSVFLAVLMILSSVTVGFTAFAADENDSSYSEDTKSEVNGGKTAAAAEEVQPATLEEFYVACATYIEPLYNGDFDNPVINDYTIFDVANIKQAIAECMSVYNRLSDNDKNDGAALVYLAIIDALKEGVASLAENPVYASYTVTYPDGVTPSQVQNIINILDNVIAGGTVDNLLGMSIYDYIMQALGGVLSGDIINTLMQALYPIVLDGVGDLASAASMLKLYLFPKDVARRTLQNYPSAQAAISAAGNDWSKVDWTACTWETKDGKQITDIDSFIDALGTALTGLNPIIKSLLVGDNILDVIIGNPGYEKDILPFLELIGCDRDNGLLTAEEFVSDKNNLIKTLKNIINPLLSRVKEILNGKPVTELLKLVPNLSYVIGNDLLNAGILDLVKPIESYVNVGELLGNAGIDLTNIIATVNNLLAGTGIKLPVLNWAEFAGIGTFTDSAPSLRPSGVRVNIDANPADVLVQLLYYVWDVVKTNDAAIKSLLKDALGDTYATVEPYLNKIFAFSADEIIKLIVDLVSNLNTPDYTADWSFLYKDYKTTSVSLPYNVSAYEMDQTVKILTTALNNGLDILLDGSLINLVGNAVYTDSTVNAVAGLVFSLGADETVNTVLGMFGIDLSKNAIADSLKSEYPAVAAAIRSAGSLANPDTRNWKWNVTNRATFTNALVAVLRPVAPLLDVLLNNGTLNIADAVPFKGSNGYANAVKPLLDALGCNTVPAAKYTSDAKQNADYLIYNIVDPLLKQVDAILANPIAKIAEILPMAANFIGKGGIQFAVENLLYPVTNLVNPVLKIFTDESAIDFIISALGVDFNWNNIQNEIIPLLNNSVLKGIEINGKKYNLTLPNISWATLGGCGTLAGNYISGNANKVVIVLLRYVFKALDANKGAVYSLVGNDATVKQILDNVFKCGADKLIEIVVNILLKMSPVNNAAWSFKDINITSVTFTPNLTRDDFVEGLEKIDPMINELLADFANSDLKSLVTNLVYTNSIVNTLAELIYTNLEKLDIGIDLNQILAMLDVDISTYGVANTISDYKSASKEIAKSAKWSNVKFENINWGFTDGDRTGFVNALTAVLRPLFPVLRAVLSADDLVILDSIRIKGGNGYNTAIVPIAEALGISESSLVSVAAYTEQANSDKLLTSILNPLLDKVEEILASPVNSLAAILPNLAYFVENDGIYNAVTNLIKPVTNILDEIAPIYEINLDLSMLKNIDLASLVNSLISGIEVGGKPLGVKLTNIDLLVLAGRGTVEEYQSVRTYNGSRMTAKRVIADKPAVFVSVLRYIVDNLKANLDAINGLLGGLDISDDILEVINTVLDALVSEDVDSVIELLFDLLLGIGSGEGPAIEEPKTEEAVFEPFVVGNFYWAYWVILAGVIIIVGAIVFAVSRKIKSKSKIDE